MWGLPEGFGWDDHVVRCTSDSLEDSAEQESWYGMDRSMGQGKKRGIGVVFMYFLWGGGREGWWD